MAFFGGDPFGNDPFGGMHQHMRRQMHEMDRVMSSLLDPFAFGYGHAHGGGQGQLMNNARQQMIDDGGQQHRMQQQQPHAGDPFGGLMMPFGGGLLGGGLFGGGLLGGMMRHMDQMQQHVAADPHSHMYSHSTVIAFDGSGNQPRYYQSTNSVRKAGDVKETRKTVRNSATGQDEMTIGHSIGDRTHVIEKKRDRDGRIREQQRFVNLEQEHAAAFDDEFGSRVRGNTRGSGSGGRRRITGGNSNGGGQRSTEPIITLPDDDDDNARARQPPPNGNSRRRGEGPIIEEI